MITIEYVETHGWDAAIRGMRNSYNSWGESDSYFEEGLPTCDSIVLGQKDYSLMMRLVSTGSTSETKFRRFITVYFDVVAPFYWWKQFDTYKVGTVSNSCSTMHTLMNRPIETEDISYDISESDPQVAKATSELVRIMIKYLNNRMNFFRASGDQECWREVIQLLPSGYNQRRTICTNYEVLAKIYKERKNHKLTEWHTFCEWIESLPWSDIIIGRKDE